MEDAEQKYEQIFPALKHTQSPGDHLPYNLFMASHLLGVFPPSLSSDPLLYLGNKFFLEVLC